MRKNIQNDKPNDPILSLSTLQNAVNKAARDVLPDIKPKSQHKRKISENTRDLYAKRQRLYKSMSQEERNQLSKDISNSTREDYISYIDNIITDIERAEMCGDPREVARQVKILSGKNKKSSPMPSKDLNGNPIVSSEELLQSWNKFLAEKFKSPDIDLDRPREQTVSPLDLLDDKELEECMNEMNDGKAPGSWDNIPIEAFKYSEVAKQELFRVVRLIWETEIIPPELVKGIFIMLYKKNNKDDFKN